MNIIIIVIYEFFIFNYNLMTIQFSHHQCNDVRNPNILYHSKKLYKLSYNLIYKLNYVIVMHRCVLQIMSLMCLRKNEVLWHGIITIRDIRLNYRCTCTIFSNLQEVITKKRKKNYDYMITNYFYQTLFC